jgi:hypothetical protein
VKEDPDHPELAARIMQPGYADDPAPPNYIGLLWTYSPLSVADTNSTDVPSSYVDAALAWTDSPDDPRANVATGFHAGFELDPSWTDPHEGMQVIKEGRTSALTNGTIQKVGMDVVVGYGRNGTAPYAHFLDGVIIGSDGTGPFSDFGDSGSLVMEAATKKPVALLLAGDGTVTYANAIGDVVSAMKIVRFLNKDNIHQP